MDQEPQGGYPFVRPAYAITELFANINAIAPHRSVDVDGILGDSRHQQEHSGHNPNDHGIVCAGDITHDPAHGADMHAISETLRVSKDARILYVIFDGRIFDGAEGVTQFTWKPYDPGPGGSMHTDHMHVSVRQQANYYDDGRAWEVSAMPTPQEYADAILNTPLGTIDDDPNKGEQYTVRTALRTLLHQMFADRSLDQQDLAVDKKQ